MVSRWIFVIPFALALSLAAAADTILNDFQVNSNRPGHPPQQSPYSIANPATQTIYTAFSSLRDGYNWDVALARFNYDLVQQGEVTYLNVRQGTYNCQHPRQVRGSNGGVGACWIEARNPAHVYFRSLDAQGNPLSPPVQMDNGTMAIQRDTTSIAALTDGYLVVWYESVDSNRIWAQKVGFDGSLSGANFLVGSDTTESILGLEAQNHPDGRVLVSWVANGRYSYGRWLDDTGVFLGDVFEMSEPFSGFYSLGQSMVRFANDGTGILYQYEEDEIIFGALYFYVTLLNEDGTPSRPRFQAGLWLYGVSQIYQYGWRDSFPDLLYLSGNNYLKTSLFTSWWALAPDCGSSSENRIYSTIADTSRPIWGATYDYQVCLMDSQNFLLSYTPTSIALRKYSIATLDTTQDLTWIYEPGCDPAQDHPGICVHQNGDFRFSYTNHLDRGTEIYTRYFSADGTPSGADTLTSMDQNLNPTLVGNSRIKLTASDQALVVWPWQGDFWGTLYNANYWNGIIDSFNINPNYNSASFPDFDLNDNDQIAVVWRMFGVLNPPSGGRIYYQHFSQPFGISSPAIQVGPDSPSGHLPGQPDVGLRDDGRFLVCWSNQFNYDYDVGPIYDQAGINYNTLQGSPIQISDDSDGGFCSAPSLEKSPTGYWVTWVQFPYTNLKRLFLRGVDSLGTPVGEVIQITETAAPPVGDPTLAVSSTGNFVIAWQDSINDAGDILARQFNPDGSFYGDYAYRVNSDSGNALQKEPAVAFGPNDELYFTWTDYRTPYHQGDIYCKVIEWADALAARPSPAPIPMRFSLNEPRPNPFNGMAVVSFQLPVAGQVSLRAYDISGRLVKTLAEGRQTAGTHQVVFEGSRLASGIYLLRLEAGAFTQTRKMVLLK